MPAQYEKVPFKRLPGRVQPDPSEHIPTDKHGQTLQGQHDPSPDWGRTTETRLAAKRHAAGRGGILK